MAARCPGHAGTGKFLGILGKRCRMVPPPMRLFPLTLVLAGLSAMGCGDYQRYRECDRLAEVANPALADLERLGNKSKQPGVRSYARAADGYAALQKALKAVPLKDNQLENALAGYVDMLALAEKQLRLSGKVLEGKDEKDPLKRHQQSMQVVLSQEQSALTRLRALCRP